MKRQVLAVAALVILSGLIAGQESFSEREATARQAEVFFTQLQLDSPAVRQLETLVAGKNYMTAFLNLSEALARDHFFGRVCVRLEHDRFELTQRFYSQAEELSPGSWQKIMTRLEITSPLQLALLTIHSLTRRYERNELFGVMAMRHWLTLLHLMQLTAAHRQLTVVEAGLLELGARFGFFKKGKSWKKKAQRYFRRHPESRLGDEDLRLLASMQSGA